MIVAVRALSEHQDQWQALRRGDVTVQTAGEEVLRWTTPTKHFGRSAVADLPVGDRTIATGDLVTLWFSQTYTAS